MSARFAHMLLLRRDDNDCDDDDISTTYDNRPATRVETIVIAIAFSVAIFLILLGACHYYGCLTCRRRKKIIPLQSALHYPADTQIVAARSDVIFAEVKQNQIRYTRIAGDDLVRGEINVRIWKR